ncbi:MAG: hypothetical protein ACE5Q6_20620 [Dehalococcoidia bacterium]
MVALGILFVSPASAGAVNCDTFPGVGDKTDPYVVSGTLEDNLEITHGVCQVIGTVEGNVMITDEACAGWPGDLTTNGDKPFTAIDVSGGTIEGNIEASGGACLMVWLEDGASVEGNVIYAGQGNLVFKNVISGEPGIAGAKVDGNLEVNGGFLSPSGSSTSNYVDGNIICNGGEPKKGLGSGSETDWDGDGTDDGTIGGNYESC